MSICILEMLLVHNLYAVMQLCNIFYTVDLSHNHCVHAASCDAYIEGYC